MRHTPASSCSIARGGYYGKIRFECAYCPFMCQQFGELVGHWYVSHGGGPNGSGRAASDRTR